MLVVAHELHYRVETSELLALETTVLHSQESDGDQVQGSLYVPLPGKVRGMPMFLRTLQQQLLAMPCQ